MKFIKPIIKKRLRKGRPVDTINEAYHSTGYYLKELPLNGVVEMWKLQVTHFYALMILCFLTTYANI